MKINNFLASCDVYGSGSIEQAHINCDELDKATHDITDNAHKASSADDYRHESFGTPFSTAATELNNQNIERLPTASTNLDELLGGWDRDRSNNLFQHYYSLVDKVDQNVLSLIRHFIFYPPHLSRSNFSF
ncbi:MAG: hypothetical protein M3044_21630 [Thermoproteota archaeon]|nr:hypothetical protein [Thermoproteota archaeon]